MEMAGLSLSMYKWWLGDQMAEKVYKRLLLGGRLVLKVAFNSGISIVYKIRKEKSQIYLKSNSKSFPKTFPPNDLSFPPAKMDKDIKWHSGDYKLFEGREHTVFMFPSREAIILRALDNLSHQFKKFFIAMDQTHDLPSLALCAL